MAQHPVLITPRLRLEPFGAAHLTDRYVGWLNDPEVVRFSEQRHRHHTLATATAYTASFAGTPHGFWAIVAFEPGLGHIGNITASVDQPNDVADVGILLGHKAVWGRGYGFEAWQAVCRYLLDECRLRKVTAGTVSVNHGMLSIMRRAGMGEDGTRRRQCVIDGMAVDLVHMALFAEAR